ncbi:hypothetical protein EDD22DRAFT_268145 [Suillus occidentalis]|nr:hypothetical protein EDD22DRAFT_268145 [Suillus occidentalis]
MNVSDLLQDSPSQHRKRPSGTTRHEHFFTCSPTSRFCLKSNSVSPQSNAAQPRPTLPPTPNPNAPYPAPPSYYPPSPFVPQRITPRQQPEQLMASLQHPHPHNPWGPHSSSASSTLVSASTRAPLPVERSPVVQRQNVLNPPTTAPGPFFSTTHTLYSPNPPIAPSHSPQTSLKPPNRHSKNAHLKT